MRPVPNQAARESQGQPEPCKGLSSVFQVAIQVAQMDPGEMGQSVEPDQSVFVLHLPVRMSFLKQNLKPDLRRMWIPGSVARKLVWQGWAVGQVAALKMQ